MPDSCFFQPCDSDAEIRGRVIARTKHKQYIETATGFVVLEHREVRTPLVGTAISVRRVSTLLTRGPEYRRKMRAQKRRPAARAAA